MRPTCKGIEHFPRSQTLKFLTASLSRLPSSHSIISPVFVPTTMSDHRSIYINKDKRIVQAKYPESVNLINKRNMNWRTVGANLAVEFVEQDENPYSSQLNPDLKS